MGIHGADFDSRTTERLAGRRMLSKAAFAGKHSSTDFDQTVKDISCFYLAQVAHALHNAALSNIYFVLKRHSLYQWLLTWFCCPVGSFFAQIPVVNDDLPGRLISGRVQLKPNVREFRGSSVIFVDGSTIDKVCITCSCRPPAGCTYDYPIKTSRESRR